MSHETRYASALESKETSESSRPDDVFGFVREAKQYAIYEIDKLIDWRLKKVLDVEQNIDAELSIVDDRLRSLPRFFPGYRPGVDRERSQLNAVRLSLLTRKWDEPTRAWKDVQAIRTERRKRAEELTNFSVLD